MNPKRDNYSCMANLNNGCTEARKILRRKRSNPDQLRHAAALLGAAVRSLRSWHATACEQSQWQRRGKMILQGRVAQLERELEHYGKVQRPLK